MEFSIVPPDSRALFLQKLIIMYENLELIPDNLKKRIIKVLEKFPKKIRELINREVLFLYFADKFTGCYYNMNYNTRTKIIWLKPNASKDTIAHEIMHYFQNTDNKYFRESELIAEFLMKLIMKK
jgi:hypothetical protein